MRGGSGGGSACAVVTALLVAGCSPDAKEPGDRVVARAWEKYLTWSDLRQVVPVEASPEDSAALAEQYISNWTREQAVLHAAELNLAASAKDFEARLESYRNSLLKYAYEEALVAQKLDTVVALSEIEAYYDRERANFELGDNILRARWFKVREDDRRTLRRLEEHFMSGKSERMHELEIWLAERGIPITDRSGTWTTLDAFRAEVPVVGDVPPASLTDGKRFVAKDREGITWFVDLLELRTRGSVSPLELVAPDIRAIIINRRKLDLVERMREDLHREAIERKDIELL